MKALNRRKFIKDFSAVTLGTAYAGKVTQIVPVQREDDHPLCLFTKCLQFLPWDELGDTIAGMGFKGADLTVRKGGIVEPENVERDLPKVVQSLTKSGLEVPMMVTDITGADYPDVEKFLSLAVNLGIKHYRLGYLYYEQEKSIQENLGKDKKRLKKLEQVNRKIGIKGEYQNHYGTYVGSPVWDLYWLLKDSDPDYLGSQYDIRHAVCEGGKSWPLGMKLLAPWIGTVDIKDFKWIEKGEKWKPKNLPLGEGMVPFDQYFHEYNRLGLKGPVSVHYEYDLGGAERGGRHPDMSLKEIQFRITRDLQWLKEKMAQHDMIN